MGNCLLSRRCSTAVASSLCEASMSPLGHSTDPTSCSMTWLGKWLGNFPKALLMASGPNLAPMRPWLRATPASQAYPKRARDLFWALGTASKGVQCTFSCRYSHLLDILPLQRFFSGALYSSICLEEGVQDFGVHPLGQSYL